MIPTKLVLDVYYHGGKLTFEQMTELPSIPDESLHLRDEELGFRPDAIMYDFVNHGLYILLKAHEYRSNNLQQLTREDVILCYKGWTLR